MPIFRPAAQAWITAAVVVADQVTKMLIRDRLPAYGDSIVVIPGFFDLTRVHNTGVAFGTLNVADFPYKPLVVSLLAVGALAGLTWYTTTLDATQRLTRLGLAFVIGGAIGNLIDRVATGYVLDFFDFYWGGWHFWAFNVADAAINVGVGFMILDLLGIGRSRVSRAV